MEIGGKKARFETAGGIFRTQKIVRARGRKLRPSMIFSSIFFSNLFYLGDDLISFTAAISIKPKVNI